MRASCAPLSVHALLSYKQPAEAERAFDVMCRIIGNTKHLNYLHLWIQKVLHDIKTFFHQVEKPLSLSHHVTTNLETLHTVLCEQI